MSDTRSKIIQSAETMVRSGGYNGFSFREIATEIGIKSSSVHHHFPTKESLALEVAQRYETLFFSALGDPKAPESNTETLLRTYCDTFHQAFTSSGRACLCGVLSNEAEQLPQSVRELISGFVDANIKWLTTAIQRSPNDTPSNEARDKAQLVYCSLEGAMGVAALKQDADWITRASTSLLETLAPPNGK